MHPELRLYCGGHTLQSAVDHPSLQEQKQVAPAGNTAVAWLLQSAAMVHVSAVAERGSNSDAMRTVVTEQRTKDICRRGGKSLGGQTKLNRLWGYFFLTYRYYYGAAAEC